MWWVFTALAGCGTTVDDHVSTRERAAALLAGSTDACELLRPGSERGICVALGAHARAMAGDVVGAWQTCQSMAAGPWRDECHFLVTDTAGVTGDEAKAWCQHSGRWRLQCVGHAMAREANELMAGHARGQEERLAEELNRLAARYVGQAQAHPRAHSLLVGHLAERDPERPFHEGVCGSAPPRACRDAYVERVRRAASEGGEGWRAACGRVVPVERAEMTGQPLWEPAMDDVAAEAWSVLCER